MLETINWLYFNQHISCQYALLLGIELRKTTKPIVL